MKFKYIPKVVMASVMNLLNQTNQYAIVYDAGYPEATATNFTQNRWAGIFKLFSSSKMESKGFLRFDNSSQRFLLSIDSFEDQLGLIGKPFGISNYSVSVEFCKFNDSIPNDISLACEPRLWQTPAPVRNRSLIRFLESSKRIIQVSEQPSKAAGWKVFRADICNFTKSTLTNYECTQIVMNVTDDIQQDFSFVNVEGNRQVIVAQLSVQNKFIVFNRDPSIPSYTVANGKSGSVVPVGSSLVRTKEGEITITKEAAPYVLVKASEITGESKNIIVKCEDGSGPSQQSTIEVKVIKSLVEKFSVPSMNPSVKIYPKDSTILYIPRQNIVGNSVNLKLQTAPNNFNVEVLESTELALNILPAPSSPIIDYQIAGSALLYLTKSNQLYLARCSQTKGDSMSCKTITPPSNFSVQPNLQKCVALSQTQTICTIYDKELKMTRIVTQIEDGPLIFTNVSANFDDFVVTSYNDIVYTGIGVVGLQKSNNTLFAWNLMPSRTTCTSKFSREIGREEVGLDSFCPVAIGNRGNITENIVRILSSCQGKSSLLIEIDFDSFMYTRQISRTHTIALSKSYNWMCSFYREVILTNDPSSTSDLTAVDMRGIFTISSLSDYTSALGIESISRPSCNTQNKTITFQNTNKNGAYIVVLSGDKIFSQSRRVPVPPIRLSDGWKLTSSMESELSTLHKITSADGSIKTLQSSLDYTMVKFTSALASTSEGTVDFVWSNGPSANDIKLKGRVECVEPNYGPIVSTINKLDAVPKSSLYVDKYVTLKGHVLGAELINPGNENITISGRDYLNWSHIERIGHYDFPVMTAKQCMFGYGRSMTFSRAQEILIVNNCTNKWYKLRTLSGPGVFDFGLTPGVTKDAYVVMKVSYPRPESLEFYFMDDLKSIETFSYDYKGESIWKTIKIVDNCTASNNTTIGYALDSLNQRLVVFNLTNGKKGVAVTRLRSYDDVLDFTVSKTEYSSITVLTILSASNPSELRHYTFDNVTHALVQGPQLSNLMPNPSLPPRPLHIASINGDRFQNLHSICRWSIGIYL